MTEIKLNDFKIAMNKIITKIKKTQLEIFEIDEKLIEEKNEG